MSVFFKKLKSVLLFFVAIWKRALCCFSRRRRPSEFIPLTQIGIVSNKSVELSQDNWGTWSDEVGALTAKPTTVQEHIEFYRQQAMAARQISEESEVQENFFDDMAPTITRQKKLYVNKNSEDNNTNVTRLSLDPQNITIPGEELGEWDEHSGWEDQTLDDDAREALRETRKQARQKKIWEQQQRRQEKFMRPFGAKVPL